MSFDGLFVCPRCEHELTSDWTCRGCGSEFAAADGIPDLRVRSETRSEQVRRFYESAPFPGYPERDSLEWLRLRAGRSEFARMLERAIPADATILDAGCGTGQMSLFLARAGRRVVGADIARASLRLAAAAAKRFELDGVRFVQTDLHCPALRKGAFDVVYSSGVLHHTPDPRAAFARVAQLARPGGWIVLGLYNAIARIPLRVRRAVARLSGFRWTLGDPVLRDRAGDRERCEAWLRDQYQHPEEHRHTLGEVQQWFASNGVDYVRAYPSALLATQSDDLFETAGDAWAPEQWLAQLAWMTTLGHEGGLFVTVGRRETPG
jgi:2-polyprenyl-3-methyl-5-hydroxy-6-metoxy-1,4-benzoquinol methylase